MLSGEIYLRLKPYLVVEISSDIVTEHCCQVCVLSMMFCRSDCRLCADMVSDCAIWKLFGEQCGPPGQRGIQKYSSHLIFTFYTNRDKSVLELFHVVVFQWQRFSVLTGWPRQSKSSLKLLNYGRKIQNDVHIMTINQHYSVSYAFSAPNWSEMCGVADVLTVLLLSPTR